MTKARGKSPDTAATASEAAFPDDKRPLPRANWSATHTLPTISPRVAPLRIKLKKWLRQWGFFGERGGTRTLDPMIKSHVLYRLSYALTRRAV